MSTLPDTKGKPPDYIWLAQNSMGAWVGLTYDATDEWATKFVPAARVEELEADAARLRFYLRQHAISHDPTKRPMRSRCNICEAEWGGDDAQEHGTGCPFARALAAPERGKG